MWGLYHEMLNKGCCGTPYKQMNSKARARQAAINGRLKVFGCLSTRWRHLLKRNGTAFGAVANIIQVQIKMEENSFEVEYNDRCIQPTKPRWRLGHHNT